MVLCLLSSFVSVLQTLHHNVFSAHPSHYFIYTTKVRQCLATQERKAHSLRHIFLFTFHACLLNIQFEVYGILGQHLVLIENQLLLVILYEFINRPYALRFNRKMFRLS